MIPKFFLVGLLNIGVLAWAGYSSFGNPWLLIIVIISFINIIREANICAGRFTNQEVSE